MLLGGYDLVYECVGTGRSITDALKFVQSRGTLVTLGTSGITLVDTTPLWFSELTVIGAYGRQIEDHAGGRVHTYGIVLDLMRQGRLKPSGWLTHTFELSDYRRAFASLLGGQRGKVVKAAFRH
jgi:threonine dehydrogenase-like Zn-dependent dehydrogenase